MINRIKTLLSGGSADVAEAAAAAAEEEIRLAAAALLVEAAWLDQDFDKTERGHIIALVTERFGLSGAEAESLVAAAEAEVRSATQILPFTRVIKDRFSHEERIEMVEMLWQVVYADGVLHDHEAALMRRIGGLIYVNDRERGAARKRALARISASA
ncbi:MAG: TerB family tellurite resistance protein [Alphaproteobacteria bacterium]|nr:TerB family tellurite resistance protein [Alphaproteobacteria bacterium]